MAALKLGVTQAIKFMPEPICSYGLFSLTFGGYGAAMWNIGVMSGSGPAAIPLLIGLFLWQKDNWFISGQQTCANPWQVEPPVFFKSGFNSL